MQTMTSSIYQNGLSGKHKAAIVSMILGPILVFGLILAMNQFIGRIDKTPPQEVYGQANQRRTQERNQKS